jgi:hypothetical protein
MTRILLCLLFLLGPAAVHAQNLLPSDKEIEVLEEGERNPFGRRGPDPARVVIEDVETEESRLQTSYGRMEVSGFADGPYGRSVLLGRHKIFPGDVLPSILPRQTEVLRVEEITADRIELIFIERQSRPTPRKITLRYDITPKVRHLISTQIPLSRASGVDLQGQFPPPKNPAGDEADIPSESGAPTEGD